MTSFFHFSHSRALLTAACSFLTIAASTTSGAADTATAPLIVDSIEVLSTRERADGPVNGYRATRSSTFTKTDLPLRDIPASLTVVPEPLMRDLGGRGIADLLRYVPGTTWHQGEGNRDQVVLRGNSTSADFFVDGMRDDAQVFRDPYDLERLEILKGPGGMAFGRGGAGGIVNRVTKQPAAESIRDLLLSIGSYADRRIAVDIGNATGGRIAWRFNGMGERSNSFRDGVHAERTAAHPTLLWQMAPQTRLTLGAEHFHDTRTADRGIPSRDGLPFDTDPARFFGNAGQSRATGDVDAATATLTHAFDNDWQLKNALRLTHYDKFYQNVYAGGPVSAVNTLPIVAYNNANRRTNTFNQTDLSGNVDWAGQRHQLLIGLEVGRQDSTNRRHTGYFGTATTATVSAATPIATATDFRATGTDADNRVTADIAALTLQDLAHLTPTLKLLVGVRADRFRVGFDDRRTTVTPADLSRTDRAISPRAGLIWNADVHTSFYASLSESFLPSGEQLGLATTTADLTPERARNLEWGWRRDLAHDLSVSAALFRLDKRDVRVTDPTQPGTFVKTGKQRTEGVELGLQGHLASRWQVFAGYAYLDGRIRNPIVSGTTASTSAVIPAGRRIGLVPTHALSVWNKLRLSEGWDVGIGVTGQSAVYTSFTNSVTLPRFWRADAALYYTFDDRKTRLAFNVENLANARYYPTADGDNNITPGAPRNAKLTLSVTF